MDRYAVIGNPVNHSKSPAIHETFAKQSKQELIYTAIKSPLNDFTETITAFKAAGGKGANITLPFKTEAFTLADHHSDLAKLAQAANTLVFQDNNIIYADNTDGPGLVQDLTHNHHYSLQGKCVLVIGAGGATRGILGPLLAQAPERLTIANRSPEKARVLAKQFAPLGNIDGVSLTEIEKKPFDLIINATSTSISGQTLSLPEAIIGKHSWCYDLFYANKLTNFLAWGKALGAENYLDGLGMLVEQAAGSFYLWRGIYPETKSVIEKLRSSARN